MMLFRNSKNVSTSWRKKIQKNPKYDIIIIILKMEILS